MSQALPIASTELSLHPEPVLQSSIYMGDGFRIVVKVNNLSEETYTEITDPSNGEVVTIPSRFLRAMGATTNPLYNVHQEKTQRQRDTHHPLDLFENLVTRDVGTKRAKVIVEGTNINEVGTPVLTWQDEVQVNIIQKKNNIIVNPNSGWNLTLIGFPEEILGFAAWNDLDAITRLSQYMKNKKGLSAQLGLTVPTKGNKLTSSLVLQEYAKDNSIPKMTTNVIRKKLADAGYTNSKKKSQIAPLVVEVDGKQVVIAIGISRYTSYLARSVPPGQIVSAIVSSSSSGWRVVNLEGLLKENKLTNKLHYSNPIWFTLISENNWNQISPGIPMVAKIDRNRSWF